MPEKSAKTILGPTLRGIFAGGFLLAAYFGILSLISGWTFALSQFANFWYFIVALSFGFGIQIGLYFYLRDLIGAAPGDGKVLGVTGTTSGAAMISCCTHYLANLLPVLGATGIAALAAQYQIELFWVGLLFNFGGVFYMTRRVREFKQK